ncbi:MAG: hypothetical protein ACFFCW_19790 [Candidatus Hodarchaeota archaeon]
MKEFDVTSQLTSLGEFEESPFLESRSFVVKKPEPVEEKESTPSWSQAYTPFRSVYELNGQEELMEPEEEAFAEFLTELYDEEFDEAVYELMGEMSEIYESQLSTGYGNMVAQEAQTEQYLEERLTPLVREIEMFMDNMAQSMEGKDLESMSEAEIGAIVDQYVPTESFSPAFENLFGWIKKKVKKVVKLAKKGIKKLGKLALKGIWGKLNRLAKEMLNKVLKFAINKLPKRYRALAERLKKKFVKEIEEETYLEDGEVFQQDVTRIQREFDVQIAHLLFVEEEAEQEVAISEYLAESEEPMEDPLHDLDRARAQFISQINQLEEGEDPTPVIENFVTAILTAARLAIKFIGRKKVHKYLSDKMADFASKFIDRKNARALSRVLVDAGLRLLKLEVTPEDEAQVAGSTVASIIEETVREVAQLPEYILDKEDLLEGYVLDAFEHAAAKNLPHVLPEQVYQQRPELREICKMNGSWIMLPLQGRKFYKKHTRVFETMICPHTAQMLTSFGKIPLAAFLRDQLGLRVGKSIKARVHLYEAIPGSRLYLISKFEKGIPGLGTTAKSAWAQFHPLTREAAGLLAGETGLGRDVSSEFLVNQRMIDDSNGQRFYYLEIDGVRPQMAMTPDGIPALRRSSQVNVKLNFVSNQVQLNIFLSEAETQDIALKLRQQVPVGSAVKYLITSLKNGLDNAFSPGMHHHIKIVHPAVIPGYSHSMMLRKLPQQITGIFAERILEWAGKGIADYLRNNAQQFVTAANHELDGVTLTISLDNPPGLSVIREFINGAFTRLNGQFNQNGLPGIKIMVYPGFYRE